MLFFKEDKDYKNVVSGLRRELKGLGLPVASHAQMVEALAKALGHKSWAALQVAHKNQPSAVPAPAVTAPNVPKPKETYRGENVDIQDDLEHKGYRLFNLAGELDLAAEGNLVTGLNLYAIEGTVEDILSNTCIVTYVERTPSGELDATFDGTDVNWDGTETRCDSRGQALWWDENSEAISEDRCILVPEGIDRQSNILSEEVVEEYDLPTRAELVDSALRYLTDKGLRDQALQEMPYDGTSFGDEFYENANQLFRNGKREASALGLAQRAAGFCMHVGEFKLLRARLADAE